jgi:phosphate transport system permease protein
VNPSENRPVITLSFFTAGNVLAIMILPIITSVVREVFAQVPASERQAAYGLGATRWEVMRHIVLHRGRPGIIGATMLGVGRALGETIAVLLLIGSTNQTSTRLFAQGQSMAGIIATQYKEAAPEHVKALMAVGVTLFALAIIVNMLARFIVSRFAHLDDAAV